jgi:hypothetical protein
VDGAWAEEGFSDDDSAEETPEEEALPEDEENPALEEPCPVSLPGGDSTRV